MKLLSIIFIFVITIAACSRTPEQPDIIFILTDQQSETMMSCSGNEYLNTPAMDYIANNGIRFTRAYTANPVCSPARVSLMTGRFPGYFLDKEGNPARENRGSMNIPQVSEEVFNTTIASYLKDAGYDLVYGGKEHLPKSLNAEALGFYDLTDNDRYELAEKAADYIRGDHEKPYFMFVSLINPHDICFMALYDFSPEEYQKRLSKGSKTELENLREALKLPEGVDSAEFFAKYCPPLPPNYLPQQDEPKAIEFLLDQRSFKRGAREAYTDEDWRMHRWAYARLTEKVDGKIQTILDALKESGREKNTLVIFTSDHGDNDASHKLEHKTTMYEESANIPFAAMWKGQIPAGQVNTTNLISNGLDLLPTLCDYAGIEGAADPRGESLKPLFEGKYIDWRNTLGVETEIGRMVVSEDGYKYIRYDAAGIEEYLMDLNKDPYETKHFTNDQAYTEVFNNLKNEFNEVWFPGLPE